MRLRSGGRSTFRTTGDASWAKRERLEAHLEAMVQKYDAPVQCVAHSMGCMLLLAVMHRRPELIHSAIFAGGTFAGGIGYHFLLARGERIGLNGTLVAPETVATWPCAYATASPVGDPLLIGDDGTPHWQVLDKAKLKKGEAAPIEIDWYDIETWERLGLGVFGHGEKPSDEMRAHVATACASASSSSARCARCATTRATTRRARR